MAVTSTVATIFLSFFCYLSWFFKISRGSQNVNDTCYYLCTFKYIFPSQIRFCSVHIWKTANQFGTALEALYRSVFNLIYIGIIYSLYHCNQFYFYLEKLILFLLKNNLLLHHKGKNTFTCSSTHLTIFFTSKPPYIIKEFNFCFQKLVSGALHTLYWGGFPDRGSNPGPRSQARTPQQHMGKRSNQLSHADNPTLILVSARCHLWLYPEKEFIKNGTLPTTY